MFRIFALTLVVVGVGSMKANAQFPPNFAPNPYPTLPAVNPYAANPYAANPYAVNPYAMQPGVNPYAVNPYAMQPSVSPYAVNPYAVNPNSVPSPYSVNPYTMPNVNPYAVNPYNPSPYPATPVPSTGFAVNNSGVRYSVNVGRFSINSFSNNLSVVPVGGTPAIGTMPGYLPYSSIPSVAPARAPSAPAVLDLSGIDLDR